MPRSCSLSQAGFITRPMTQNAGSVNVGCARATIVVTPLDASETTAAAGHAPVSQPWPVGTEVAAARLASAMATALSFPADTSAHHASMDCSCEELDCPQGAKRAGASASEAVLRPPLPFRIDVARYAGDTFQFHAFYRAFRETLRPLIGAPHGTSMSASSLASRASSDSLETCDS